MIVPLMYSDQQTAAYEEIIVDQTPMIDVRSPVEFKAGSVPSAVNIALLDDDERHQVGVTYRNKGKEEAFRVANNLVDESKQHMLSEIWCAYLQRYPDAVVYCARGGMRSETAARWIYQQSGTQVSRIEGGYKAMRTYMLSRLEPATIASKPVLRGGRTGSGKTRLLNSLANSIDLEALANHRGSTFGRFTTPQPGQADFENRLSAALIKHCRGDHSHLLLEDEGRHVGSRYLPKELSEFFLSGDLVVLEIDFEERVENIYQEYVIEAQNRRGDLTGKADPTQRMWHWFEEMNHSLSRIAKRLGASRYEEVRALLESGCYHQKANGDPKAHKHWIRLLLRHYYDPMYDYQLKKRGKTPVLSGRENIILQYLRSLNNR
ncbi:MAG: tRNA 2-selenouridine(34) synthase MnmH [Desulfobulbaceae bacterium]|nr:MAG: tRNA 2-selenouridine(34) synthase MnmH [Desulfobulbaceae bacterium]